MTLPETIFLVGGIGLGLFIWALFHILGSSTDYDEDTGPCPFCENPIPVSEMDRLSQLTVKELKKIANKKFVPRPWLTRPMTDEEIEQWVDSSSSCSIMS